MRPDDPAPPPVPLEADVCVVGGGPAGLMTALLLVRQGRDVVVLEKHADFHRDFRGDTVHPSTLDLLDELSLLEEFLALPHDEMTRAQVAFGDEVLTLADFTRLPTRCRFLAFVPQWDFLDLLARTAEREPGFRLHRETRMTELLMAGEQVVGVRAESPDGPISVRARLVIGADGRGSRVREAAGLRVVESGSALDVLWLRLPRHPQERLPLFTGGDGALICIDRGDFWQVAVAVPQGTAGALRERGVRALHRRIAAARPELTDRASRLTWEDVHLLEVRVDHLPRWHRPGLLCLGDAAHAMSPAGGVGINLAIQDAVAAARMLGPVLAERSPTGAELDAVRRRRLPAARIVQRLQSRILAGAAPTSPDRVRTRPPLGLRGIAALPPARHLVGRLLGIGLRPEHVSPARERSARRAVRTGAGR